MRLTIIPDDKCVILDGDARMDLTFEIDPTIHAVQWYESHGEVEYKSQLVDGVLVKPENQVIDSIAPFQAAIDAWNAYVPPEPEPVEPKPVSYVTARQARLLLYQDGLLDQVEQLVASQGGAVQIEWEYATIIERDSALTQAIAAELQLTPEQIQDMFTRASVL